MAHHHKKTRRRRHNDSSASSSSVSDADSTSSASTSSSASRSSSDHDARRRRRRSKKYGWGDVSSTSSESESTSSDDDDDRDARRRHRRGREKEQRKRIEVIAGLGVCAICVALALMYALRGSSSSASGGTTGSTGSRGSTGSTAGSGTSGGGGSGSGSGSGPSSGGSASGTSTSSSALSSSNPPSSTGGGGSSGSSGSATATSTASAADASNTGPYKLVQDMSGTGFFDSWTFWNTTDPTHVRWESFVRLRETMLTMEPVLRVDYLGRDAAQSAGLISATATSAIMKVDNTTTLASGANRNSIRIASNTAMDINSLVIADIIAMPWGCATWWMNGPNWPDGGGDDVIEGVSLQTANQISLHTSDSGCKQATNPNITGKAVAANDDCNANDNGNAGCSYTETASSSYGEAFNNAGGGVLVTSFTTAAISVWFWSRADIPDNIKSGSPDNSTWGKPTATWPSSSCDISKYFGAQTLIFDTTLCGDWAGTASVWAEYCSAAASTCSDYVADPTHFDTAYWEVGYVRVYTL
ncbi:hypothetical protein JCM1840_003273 [Sporobolomyces johnsonii]